VINGAACPIPHRASWRHRRDRARPSALLVRDGARASSLESEIVPWMVNPCSCTHTMGSLTPHEFADNLVAAGVVVAFLEGL
jgi:hypothetical protein